MTGLILPIAIHFWNKKKVKVIQIGSTQFLREMEPRQSRSLALNELWLLLIRMMVIATLVMLLAEPYWNYKKDNTAITYLIEPALLEDKSVVTFLDGLENASFRLLQTGFPELEDFNSGEQDLATTPDYWQLAGQMEQLPTDSIIVLTKGYTKGVRGARPSVSARIEWRILNNDTEHLAAIAALASADSLEIIKAKSSPGLLSVFKEKILSNSSDLIITNDSLNNFTKGEDYTIPLENEKALSILIVHSEKTLEERNLISANLRAISTFINYPIRINTSTQPNALPDQEPDCLIWLRSAVPERYNGMLVSYVPDALADSLLVPTTRPDVFNITRMLDIDDMLEQRFGEKLLKIIRPNKTLLKRLENYDKRVMALNELRPRPVSSKKNLGYIELKMLNSWLWVLLAVLMIGERIIAKIRKQ